MVMHALHIHKIIVYCCFICKLVIIIILLLLYMYVILVHVIHMHCTCIKGHGGTVMHVEVKCYVRCVHMYKFDMLTVVHYYNVPITVTCIFIHVHVQYLPICVTCMYMY